MPRRRGARRPARRNSARSSIDLIDARGAYFEQVLKFLIMGNVRRGSCIRCASAPSACCRRRRSRRWRCRSAPRWWRTAARPPATTRCASKWRCARWRRISRSSRRCATAPSSAPEQLKYLEDRGLPIPPFGAAYSVNRGLWGVTIGGKETLTSAGSIPESAWVLSKDAFTQPRAPERHVIGFERGRPVEPRRRGAVARSRSSSGSRRWPARSASAAASIWATRSSAPRDASRSRRPRPRCCSTAHRELEKLVLTGKQARIKESRRAALRRPGARGTAPRSGVPRHRGAARRPRKRASAARSRCCSGPGRCSSRA